MYDDIDNVRIAVQTFRLRAEWVHTLKEKRMIVQSLVAKLRNHFHISVNETGEQDVHQMIVIAAAAIVPDQAYADRLMEQILTFVETNTDAVLIEEEKEIR